MGTSCLAFHLHWKGACLLQGSQLIKIVIIFLKKKYKNNSSVNEK